MATNEKLRIIIASMDRISIVVRDCNFHKEQIEITHVEACKIADGDLLFKYTIEQNKCQHMIITIN